MKKSNYFNSAVFSLVTMHIVGIAGLNIPATQSSFESISHINISVSLLWVYFADQSKSSKLLLFLLLSFTIGMLVEIIGVQSGLIFGKYYYTNTFGPGIGSVPIAIGLNWFLLSLCAMNIVKSENVFCRCLSAGMLMTGIDYILEPFAIKHGFWVWEQGEVPPVQNYIAWFIISSFICYIYTMLKLESNNRLAAFYFALLITFLLINKFIGG